MQGPYRKLETYHISEKKVITFSEKFSVTTTRTTTRLENNFLRPLRLHILLFFSWKYFCFSSPASYLMMLDLLVRKTTHVCRATIRHLQLTFSCWQKLVLNNPNEYELNVYFLSRYFFFFWIEVSTLFI